ncbi:hypothetical protein GPECTOR_30g235 [Gonium pectorale]|uniref:Uncharacterized protein n=1 Tax=Gonium pectorale TaxID=33097 RepID=A0A150GE76_GONPE|nr:hypothetical protein GPECTOR_30g235 [Gonium pectorale]|eukprot:KXZ48139.1 hypothetical protein GPECTOR_30g235 [Gonium pectorale]
MAHSSGGGANPRHVKTAWQEWQSSTPTEPTVRYNRSAAGGPNVPGQRPGVALAKEDSGHTTITFSPRDFARPRRPVGQPEVTELIAQTTSANIRLKHRAASLIQRYSGTRWREATRTKWLIDVVCHIDRDYRQYIMEREAEIEALHQQLERNNELHGVSANTLKEQVESLRQRCEVLERQLRLSQVEVLDMRNRVAASEVALDSAEEAARVARDECEQLMQAFSQLAEQDASVRKKLSNRTHVMREALVASRGRVRQAAEASKRHRVEVAALLALQRERAERERQVMAAHVAGTLAAADTLRGAATCLEVQRLELELGAFKEPWAYMFGRDKSPTRDPRVTKQLGLKAKSFNMPVPY